MECCSICLGQLEEAKDLCNDCVRSKQEKRKEVIREKKTVLQLLKHESKSLKKRIKAQVKSNHDKWESVSTVNLGAANMHAMRDTTQRYAEEVVKKEEQEIANLRASIAQRRESIVKTRAFISIMQKHLEEVRQKNQQVPSSNSNLSTSEVKLPRAFSSSSAILNTTTSTSVKSSTPFGTTSTSTKSHTTRTSSSSIAPTTPSTPRVPTTSTTSKTSTAPTTSTSPSHSTRAPHSSTTTSSSSTHSSRKSSAPPNPLLRATSDPKSSNLNPSLHHHHLSHRSSSFSSSHPHHHHHTSSRHRSSSTSYHRASRPPPLYTYADLQNARLQLARRRRALVSELLSFFPINPSPSSSETETIILNVTMPNNGVYHYYRPDALSTALGYVAHVVYIIAGYLGVTLPWQIEFAGARSTIWDPFNGKRHPLFGTKYDDIDPGLVFLNRDIVYLCGSQGIHVPLSAHRCTLPNLLALLRCPTLGMPGPLEALRPEPVVRYSRPPLRVTEPPSPVAKRDPLKEESLPKTETRSPKKEGDLDDEFIVVERSSVPTPEQTEELEQFERAMFIDTTT